MNKVCATIENRIHLRSLIEFENDHNVTLTSSQRFLKHLTI